MSCCGKAKNVIKKIDDIVQGNTNYILGVETELSQKRFAICEKCLEKFTIASFGKKNTYICKKCGCIVNSKVTIEDAKCKLNKW